MVKIPLFITKKNKNKLLKMGYNETLINYMKPDEALKILEGNLKIDDYVFKKINELFEN